MDLEIKRHQLGVGQLLSGGWQAYQSNFRSILIVTLCVYVPVELILALVPVQALAQQYNVDATRIDSLIARLAQFLIGVIATMALALIVERDIEGERLSWSQALMGALSKWGLAILTGLLSGVILLGLTLLLVVPGVIYSLYYTFWLLVVATRGRWGKEALDYSKGLVEGQWWRVFGIQLLLGVLALVIALILGIPAVYLPTVPFVSILLSLLGDLVGAYFTVTAVVFFLNNDYVYPGIQARMQRRHAAQE